MGVMVPVQVNGTVVRINPLFNLRFFFPAIVEQVVKGLREELWEDWFKESLVNAGVTEADLLTAWECYTKYMAACLSSVDQDAPRDAMNECGFLACKKEARLVILAKIGQIFTASVWWPLREGTEVDKYPDDLVRMALATNKVFRDMVT